jgi:hypothetical protein
VQLDKEKTTFILTKMLKGAALDEFKVHSTQLQMCFLKDDPLDGRLISVQLIFGCGAFVSNGTNQKNGGEYSGNDFPMERAKFLSEIYALIGREITSVRVDDNFNLLITLENIAIINICIRPDDLDEGEWLWKVFLQDVLNNSDNIPTSVYCVTEGGRLYFWSEA